MKKHIAKRAVVLSVAGLMAATALTGCGKKEEKNASARKVIEYNINDYVTLGQYTGLDVNEEITEVTDEDVEEALNTLIENHTTYEDVADRNVAVGDKVTLDYTRSVEGEDAAEETDYELIVGDGDLGEEFDDNILNLANGATITFTIAETTYDGETGEETPVDATYSVTVKNIKQPIVPEVTDEFIAANTEYDTLELYRENTKAEMLEDNYESAKSTTQAELLNMIVDDSEVSGCPAFIFNMNYNSIAQSYATYGSYFGADLETYMSYAGVTFEDFQHDAITMTKQTLVIEAIAKAAGIDITDEQFKENLNTYVEEYDDYNTTDDVLAAFSHEELLFDMRRDVVIDYIYENNNVTQVMVSGDTQ